MVGCARCICLLSSTKAGIFWPLKYQGYDSPRRQIGSIHFWLPQNQANDNNCQSYLST
jgi:hypothetical protein